LKIFGLTKKKNSKNKNKKTKMTEVNFKSSPMIFRLSAAGNTISV